MKFPENLLHKMNDRSANDALRTLKDHSELIDFSSNDYLGFSRSEELFKTVHTFLVDNKLKVNGSTGSRLLTGNYGFYNEVETLLSDHYKSASALIFNSGYTANVGFFASVPQRGDVILYDELIHASIRDGITMSYAKAYKFKHNDLDDLKTIFQKVNSLATNIYVVTESVFSMDGDSPDLFNMAKFCKENNCYLVVDEAHAVGIFGDNGTGKLCEQNIEDAVFARIVTFGKALGCHGAAILGSDLLKEYLVNFARSFIYTTALAPHALASIYVAHKEIEASDVPKKLLKNIAYFKSVVIENNLQDHFMISDSAIQSCVISGNKKVKKIAQELMDNGFDARPILSPTVPQGKERLRFCIHSYNTFEEIQDLLEFLTTFVR